jgi:hypothetical protein
VMTCLYPQARNACCIFLLPCLKHNVQCYEVWRVYHVQNKISHGKPCPSIGGSRSFLVGYLNSLPMIKQYPEKDVIEGKMVVSSSKGF